MLADVFSLNVIPLNMCNLGDYRNDGNEFYLMRMNVKRLINELSRNYEINLPTLAECLESRFYLKEK